jgi:hypothetical protein
MTIRKEVVALQQFPAALPIAKAPKSAAHEQGIHNHDREDPGSSQMPKLRKALGENLSRVK